MTTTEHAALDAATDAAADAIAHRLSQGHSIERIIDVGERTTWWDADLVEWVAGGRQGPPPRHTERSPADDRPQDGHTIQLGPVTVVDQATAQHQQPAAARRPGITVDVGEPAPAPPATATATTSYVTALPVDQLAVDHTYQRPLDVNRAARMGRHWEPRLAGILEVSDRGPTADPRWCVIAGQHRHAAAVHAGVTALACTVHEGLTVADEARLMHELDRTTKKLSGLDQWRARRGAGDVAVLAVEAIVAGHGLRIDSGRTDGTLSAYGAAEKLWRHGGPELLDGTLAVLRGAYGLSAAGFQAPMVTAVGQLLDQYGDLVDVDRLTRALAGVRPEQLRATATALREVETGTLAELLARAIAGQYNRTAGPGARIAGGRA